jgi:hypothetical protein
MSSLALFYRFAASILVSYAVGSNVAMLRANKVEDSARRALAESVSHCWLTLRSCGSIGTSAVPFPHGPLDEAAFVESHFGVSRQSHGIRKLARGVS